MAQSTFSLSWDSYRNNICDGLSSLQQNEEFVDMTLAADGHHVKVHQMIMALASPYIKQLISSAACPHPIIFLNKVSYKTLSAILEYIYTGEVIVSTEAIPELVEAARELHIKGLEDMDIKASVRRYKIPMYDKDSEADMESPAGNLDEDVYFEVAASEKTSPSHKSVNYTIHDERMSEDSRCIKTCVDDDEDEMVVEEEVTEDTNDNVNLITTNIKEITGLPNERDIPTSMQYTVSNQGSLQMILNRYVYYLKHSNKNSTRQWRCVDYLNQTKCPALVVTRDDMVIQRISAHSHGFHDKRILKKVYANAVFAAIHEAEQEGVNIKKKTKENVDE